MANFVDRLKHSWNAFRNPDSPPTTHGYSTPFRPDRVQLKYYTERSIIVSIFERIAIDVASISIQHVRTDENGRFEEVIDSGLNQCLSIEANLDQSGRAFIQDVVMSLFDEGCVAIVPVDTTINPKVTGSYDIRTMRVGKIEEWYPDRVRVSVYNENLGNHESIILPKKMLAIIENPLYAIMNEPNSTLQRLTRKMSLLDFTDEQNSSGKLDLIFQLPYTLKGESRIKQAEDRRKQIEMQLVGSKYGIAYVDATEHITQLNRPSENNLLTQVEYLTSMLYNQLGITQAIFDGTADEKAMLNYYNRTVEPVVAAIVDAMKRAFLTKTARSQRQTIMYFRDPFKLVPVTELAEIADKMTRNEILSSNEVRAIMGYKPDKDPRADELRNKNLNQDSDQLPPTVNRDSIEVMDDE